jgi:hypothetical protein
MSEPTVVERKALAKAGIAMPDGSYYIRNVADLDNAINAVGRSTDSHDDVRKHIITRAKALDKSDMIPDNWSPDGSLKHDAWVSEVEAYLGSLPSLAHFGVKGMRWGVRRPRGTASQHPVSEDASRARATQATIKKHGTSAVSNVELQHLVTRLGLEQKHGQLNPAHVSAGKKVLDELLGVGSQVAKQQATTYAQKYAAKGIEELINKGSK